jgi:Triphosphoribosyl-dephospho-CoA synthetase
MSGVLERSPSPEDLAACMEKMDQCFCENRISPGGSADLLALSFMLLFLFDA